MRATRCGSGCPAHFVAFPEPFPDLASSPEGMASSATDQGSTTGTVKEGAPLLRKWLPFGAVAGLSAGCGALLSARESESNLTLERPENQPAQIRYEVQCAVILFRASCASDGGPIVAYRADGSGPVAASRATDNKLRRVAYGTAIDTLALVFVTIELAVVVIVAGMTAS